MKFDMRLETQKDKDTPADLDAELRRRHQEATAQAAAMEEDPEHAVTALVKRVEQADPELLYIRSKTDNELIEYVKIQRDARIKRMARDELIRRTFAQGGLKVEESNDFVINKTRFRVRICTWDQATLEASLVEY